MNHFFKEKRLSSMINFFEDNRFSSRLRAFLRFLSKIIEEKCGYAMIIDWLRRNNPRRFAIFIEENRGYSKNIDENHKTSKIISSKKIDYHRVSALFSSISFEENRRKARIRADNRFSSKLCNFLRRKLTIFEEHRRNIANP